MEQEVIHGLRILSVTGVVDELFVDVYGSADGVCGSIRFEFTDASERLRRLRLLRKWAEDGTPVTFLRGDGTVTLVSERAVVEGG